MNNTILLIVFFAVLGLVCLVLPKLVHVFYIEIIKLGSDSSGQISERIASASQLNKIRIIGIGILTLLLVLYFFSN